MAGEHTREPINIAEKFPVGKEFMLYCRDGMSREWGRWSAVVMGLNLLTEELTLRISQDWQGADTRGGQHWTEDRTIKFEDFIISVLGE